MEPESFDHSDEPEGEVLIIAVPVAYNLFSSGLSPEDITAELLANAETAIREAIDFQLQKLREESIEVEFVEEDDRQD